MSYNMSAILVESKFQLLAGVSQYPSTYRDRMTRGLVRLCIGSGQGIALAMEVRGCSRGDPLLSPHIIGYQELSLDLDSGLAISSSVGWMFSRTSILY